MLELFQFEKCPYCKKVREKLSELELDYICRNVPFNSEKRKLLTVLGDKEQVPMLIDMDKSLLMYESDDIIQYLEETYGK